MSRKYKHPPVGQKRFMAACQHTSVYQAANLLSNPLGRGAALKLKIHKVTMSRYSRQALSNQQKFQHLQTGGKPIETVNPVSLHH